MVGRGQAVGFSYLGEAFSMRHVNLVAHTLNIVNRVKFKGTKHVSVSICKVKASGDKYYGRSAMFGLKT